MEENLLINVNKLSDERRKELLESRDDYNRLISTQENALDKYLLLINGAVFNLILIFVDKIIPLKTASYIWLFYLSLIFSVASVFCVLISIKFSIYKLMQYREELDLGIENEEEPYFKIKELVNKNKWITVGTWNILSLSFLLLTLILISVFVIINIHIKHVIML